MAVAFEADEGELALCQQGVLMEGDRLLGTIQIVEVFRSFSRALIVGELRGHISDRTVAVLEESSVQGEVPDPDVLDGRGGAGEGPCGE